MSRVRIKIGGETVKDFTLTGVFIPYIYVVTRFASTHFADDTNLQIAADAWDSAGQMASDSRLITVYNKATLYGRNEWENDPSAPSAGVPIASFWLSTMNHDVSHVCTSQGWTKAMLLNDVYPCTVFYVNTHGYGVEGEHTAPAWIESDIGELIYHEEVGVVREQAVGLGVPPFNTGNPPISLAFVDACLTGLNNGFAYALLTPFDNAYTHHWCENQAEVGWRIETLVDYTSVANEGFWSALAQGKTAHQAGNEMVRRYLGLRENEINDEVAREYVSVWGDYHTRLYGVYTGTDTPAPNFWYY